MKFFTPLLILSCTHICYKQLYPHTPPASFVCLCLDLYYNTHMLAEELILQGGLALQSYVWFDNWYKSEYSNLLYICAFHGVSKNYIYIYIYI